MQVDLVFELFMWRDHRRRSGWNSAGGSMASAEGGLMPSGVG